MRRSRSGDCCASAVSGDATAELASPAMTSRRLIALPFSVRCVAAKPRLGEAAA